LEFDKKMKQTKESFTDLSWDELRQWAGVKILNRGKSYVKNVSDLSRTGGGEWIARVSGSENYATCVETVGDGEIDWHCTCPFDWGPCKHAVAVILAGIEQVKAGKKIPLLDEESDLYLALWEDGDEYDDDFRDDDFDEEEVSVIKNKGSALAKILQQKSKEELLNLLVDFADRYPEVRRRIMEDDQLASGQIDKLTRTLRKEIRNVTSEDAWFNPWKDEGSLPDYSHIREQMTALLKKGHADVVVGLGRELWERGNDQIEQSDDDGHTAGEIQECMEVVFKAVSSSSLSAPEQLLWMIDISLEDEFSISDSCEGFIRRKEYTKEHWQEVGEKLLERLTVMPKPKGDSFSSRYQRERLMDRLIEAFEKSGQQEKIIPLLEKEVHATRCYERLVEAYIQSGHPEKARSWCIKGFAATIHDAPGIAFGLRKKLRELAAKEKRFDLVASYRAEDFFDRSGRAGYVKLQKAAEKIKVWPDVRSAILCFLENGKRPVLLFKEEEKHNWPLPPPEVMAKPARRLLDRYPDFGALIDIAILEKRLDDVVQLYRKQQKTNRWGIGMGEEVAAAVAGTHPDTALGIWEQIAVGKIKLVKPKEYEAAAVYLRKMRKVYQKTKRIGEWRQLIATLRIEHKAKRRLMEVLDSLEGKRIID
jgi:uncharacterized Zn finger protein